MDGKLVGFHDNDNDDDDDDDDDDNDDDDLETCRSRHSRRGLLIITYLVR